MLFFETFVEFMINSKIGCQNSVFFLHLSMNIIKKRNKFFMFIFSFIGVLSGLCLTLAIITVMTSHEQGSKFHRKVLILKNISSLYRTLLPSGRFWQTQRIVSLRKLKLNRLREFWFLFYFWVKLSSGSGKFEKVNKW